MKKAYKGTVITSRSYDELSVMEKGYVIVEDGVITGVTENPQEGLEVIDHGDALIIPAFSDLHIHGSQFVQRGVGMDCLLFDWLNTYTFPQESKFRDIEYARIIYPQMIRELLRNGTFAANIFSTIHYEACDILFKLLKESGMYAFSGKINMDMNSPDYYVEDSERSIADTERFIVEHSGDQKVKPIIIPRFAPTCSDKLLKGLGDLAGKYNVGVHTHLVESKAEAAWSADLFPQYGSDGSIYENTGLLQGSGPKIFAHVIFPTEVEERILKQYDAVSVHCPDATSNIIAGIMPVSELHDKGFRIALGSDVGGGHFMGLYHQISRSVQISKMKEFYEPEYRHILFANAFYMATAEGGKVFGKIGKLEKGYKFNALVISGLQDEGYELSPLEQLERFCYIGDDRNITARYLDGQYLDVDETYERMVAAV